MGLEMKYFVLKPKSKVNGDPYALASRTAMRAYADMIHFENPELAEDLHKWANKESEIDVEMGNKDECRSKKVS